MSKTVSINYTEGREFKTPLEVPSDKVAIVGGSSSLSRNNLGEEIDAHNYVVRFNRAPTKGFEGIVGSKCSLRVANNHVFDNHKEDPSVWTGQPHDFIKNLKDTTILYFGPDINPWNNYKKNTDSSCSLYRFQYENADLLKMRIGVKFGANFSVGVGVIVLFVLSGVTPTIYGFDVEEDTGRSHYWEDRPAVGPCHNPSVEKQILKDLIAGNHVVSK